MPNLQRIYEQRFSEADRRRNTLVWHVLCRHFFQRFVADGDVVLDLGCGLGGFLNHIRCRRRIGVDWNPAVRCRLDPEVEFHEHDLSDLSFLEPGSIDLAFCSNVLEHLPDKSAVDRLLEAVWEKLSPGGRFMILGPNIRLLPGPYWNFWDHYVPISDRSLAEALYAAGYRIELQWARFVPYTTVGRYPRAPWLVRLYLALPPIWRLLGKQFLLIGRKPADGTGESGPG